MIHWMLAMNSQGLTRLDKWFTPHTQPERNRIKKEMSAALLKRHRLMCNFLTWREHTVVYKRYASLYFIFCVDNTDNELITLEIMHLLVRALDKYFQSVCELDLIFEFERCYSIVDEMFMGGELQETVLAEINTHACHQMDDLAKALEDVGL